MFPTHYSHSLCATIRLHCVLFPLRNGREKEERCTAEGKKRELSRRYLDAVAGRRRMEEELTMIKEEVNDGVKALHLHVEHLVGQCKSTSKAAVGTEAEGKHILYQAALKKKWGSFLKMKKARQVSLNLIFLLILFTLSLCPLYLSFYFLSFTPPSLSAGQPLCLSLSIYLSFLLFMSVCTPSLICSHI